MRLPTLYVVRHGETEWNREGRFQGALDSPLTAKGRAQAVAVGEILRRHLGPAPDLSILHSPQGRAVHTLDLLRETTGWTVPTSADDRLREIGVGDWAGRTRAEIHQEVTLPDGTPFLALYGLAPGGEGFAEVEARVRAVLATLDGPTLIVTHGITSRFIRATALGLGQEGVMSVGGGQGVVDVLRDGTQETWGELEDAEIL